MLELLIDYGRRNGIGGKPGFTSKPVKWAIECSTSGKFLGVHPLGDPEDPKNRGRTFSRCPDLSQPELVGGSEKRCHFLAESAQVVTLMLKGDENEDEKAKVREKHRFFVKLLREASEVEPDLAPAARMLEDTNALDEIGKQLQEKKGKVGDRATIRIDDRYPLESTKWHDWWNSFRASMAPGLTKSRGDDSVGGMRCLATGEIVTPVTTHLKITGLVDVGGLGTGDALICFDKESSTSYGLDQSANAAVSESAMAQYRESLNNLIREHGRRLAGAKIVCWYKNRIEAEDDPLPWLNGLEGEEQEELNARARARDLLDALRSGKRPDLASNRYYALTLSGQSGRVMVRDWMEGDFARLVECINRWFDDLEIVRLDGTGVAKPPSIEKTITCGLSPKKPNQDYKDWIKPLGSVRIRLWRAAIDMAIPIPLSVVARAVEKHSAFITTGQLHKVCRKQGEPQGLSLLYARMSLIKAYHRRKEKGDLVMEPFLNVEHPHPAYHCGRLMSVLADIQYKALGDVNVTVVQRYYAAASTTPALVLGRLVRGAQHHLGQIRDRRPFEQRISDIHGRIKDSIPPVLTLEEQSLFALGYYQQMAHDRA